MTSPGERAGNFTIIDNRIIDADLSGYAKLAYLVLQRRARPDTPAVWPSVAFVAASMGVSRPTAHRALSELADARLVTSRRRGQGKSNVYCLADVNDVDIKQRDIRDVADQMTPTLTTGRQRDLQDQDTVDQDPENKIQAAALANVLSGAPAAAAAGSPPFENIETEPPGDREPVANVVPFAHRSGALFESFFARPPSAIEAQRLEQLERRCLDRARPELFAHAIAHSAAQLPEKPVAYLQAVIDQCIRDGTAPGDRRVSTSAVSRASPGAPARRTYDGRSYTPEEIATAKAWCAARPGPSAEELAWFDQDGDPVELAERGRLAGVLR